MDYVLFKWHLFSSAKTTLKPPFFSSFFFCNATYFIKVLPKINTVTMNMLGVPCRNWAGHGPVDRKATNPLEVRGQLPTFEVGDEKLADEKNIIVSSNFVWAFSCDNCLLSTLLFFPLPLSDTHTHRNAPDGCNWCAGTAAANNCNYQKWLVSWKQSRMSFYVWVRGSDAGGTLGNSTLQLIFNTLKLIVFSHAAAPAELFTRWCEMNFWVFLLPQSW